MSKTKQGQPEGSNENPSNRPYDVLVVEDNADDVELFLRALRKVQLDTGIEINPHAFTNSSQASTRLKEQKFDVIFLDVAMPPPDGLELAKQIRSSDINRTTLIVIITGGEDRGLMARAFQAGANLFLFKPIDRMRLLRLIEMSRAAYRP